MRHRVDGKRLGRSTAHRKALFRNMVTELLEHESLRTTEAKAKELRRWSDRMITLGKRGSLHARRQAASIIRRRAVVRKLFDDLAKRYEGRAGGYTRVVKLGLRPGDAAPMAVIELIDRPEAAKPEGGRRRRRRAREEEAQRAAAG